MRGSPDYTSANRKALPPKDDDMMPIWQKASSGVYTQRWQQRGQFDEHILDIVDEDRAAITERITSAVVRIDANNKTLSDQQTTLTTQQKALSDQQVKLTAMDSTLAAQQATLQSQQASMSALLAELQKRKQVIPLPDVTIQANELITLLSTERVFANRACAGLRTTDDVIVTFKNLPVGYGIRNYSIPANDRITINVQCPVLTVGGASLVFAITAFR